MAAKLPDSYRRDAIQLYRSGLGSTFIARKLEVNRTWVADVIREAGLTRSLSEAFRLRPHPRLLTLDTGAIVSLHSAGESAEHIAASLGVGPKAILRRLAESGVHRTVAEARALINREKASTRGAKARSRQRGWGENLLAQWLEERGEAPDRQLPVGTRNLDLAIEPVAVEVWLSSYSPLSDPYCRDRIEYLAQRGWSSLYVLVARRTRVLLPTVADQIVSWLEARRRHPRAPRQHWVIRGCGEVAAVVGDDLDYGPLVPPSKGCPYHRGVNERLSR